MKKYIGVKMVDAFLQAISDVFVARVKLWNKRRKCTHDFKAVALYHYFETQGKQYRYSKWKCSKCGKTEEKVQQIGRWF